MLENGRCDYDHCVDPTLFIEDGKCVPCDATYFANAEDTACVCPTGAEEVTVDDVTTCECPENYVVDSTEPPTCVCTDPYELYTDPSTGELTCVAQQT